MSKSQYFLYLLLLISNNLSQGMGAARATVLQAARDAAITAVGEAMLQRAQQAATGVLYVQAARQTKQDLARITNLTKEKIEKVLTYLAANVAQLLEDLTRYTGNVNENIDTIQGELRTLQPKLDRAYQQAPGATSTLAGEGQPPPTASKSALGWLAAQASSAATTFGRGYVTLLEKVYGQNVTQAITAPGKALASAVASLPGIVKRLLDNRKYLIELKPDLETMNRTIDSLLNSLQAMQITLKTILNIIPELPEQNSFSSLIQKDTATTQKP